MPNKLDLDAIKQSLMHQANEELFVANLSHN
jgi:hypothetical protein